MKERIIKFLNVCRLKEYLDTMRNPESKMSLQAQQKLLGFIAVQQFNFTLTVEGNYTT